jgi:hypothetical protein
MFNPVFFLLPILFHDVAALHLSLSGKLAPSQFHKRDHISGLDDAQNLRYFTNLTLGGQPISASIDTGRQAISILSLKL